MGDEEGAACAGGCRVRGLGSSDVEARNAARRELSVGTAGAASSLLDLRAGAAGGFLLSLTLLPPAMPLGSGRQSEPGLWNLQQNQSNGICSVGERKKTNNTLLHGAVGSYLDGISAATVKIAVATTTAPDPGPFSRGVMGVF